MAHIEVSRLIPEPRPVVWSTLSDLGSQSEWMADAEKIEFVGDQRRGTGTVMRVPTRVGPFRTLDIIEITGWVEGERIDAEHRGIVKGRGSFVLAEQSGSTLIQWSESLQFPWWLGGPIGAAMARPVMRWIWARNLERLEQSLRSR